MGRSSEVDGRVSDRLSSKFRAEMKFRGSPLNYYKFGGFHCQ